MEIFRIEKFKRFFYYKNCITFEPESYSSLQVSKPKCLVSVTHWLEGRLEKQPLRWHESSGLSVKS